jgi:hypothetical protein
MKSSDKSVDLAVICLAFRSSGFTSSRSLRALKITQGSHGQRVLERRK